jgi:hypothetical protein
MLAWTGFVWQRTGTSGGLLWTRPWTCGFHKRMAISWPADPLLAFQSLCSKEASLPPPPPGFNYTANEEQELKVAAQCTVRGDKCTGKRLKTRSRFRATGLLNEGRATGLLIHELNLQRSEELWRLLFTASACQRLDQQNNWYLRAWERNVAWGNGRLANDRPDGGKNTGRVW